MIPNRNDTNDCLKQNENKYVSYPPDRVHKSRKLCAELGGQASRVEISIRPIEPAGSANSLGENKSPRCNTVFELSAIIKYNLNKNIATQRKRERGTHGQHLFLRDVFDRRWPRDFRTRGTTTTKLLTNGREKKIRKNIAQVRRESRNKMFDFI